MKLIFERSSEIIYRWCVQRYEPIFGNMPSKVGNIQEDVLGYHAVVDILYSDTVARMVVPHGKHATFNLRILFLKLLVAHDGWCPVLVELLTVQVVVVVTCGRHDILLRSLRRLL